MTAKSMDMGRVVGPRRRLSCLDYPSESGCTITITGTEEEIVRLATLHAIDAHGHQDTLELQEMIRSSLKDEPGEV